MSTPAPAAPTELSADLVVVGGGLGGVAAALTAARLGRRVILTERSPWLGGQLTTQGVPPDEHAWIEGPAASPSYTELREGIRNHYRRLHPLTGEAAADEHLNPGAGFVSRLCAEPRVAALVLEEMMSPLLSSGRLQWLREHEPMAATREGDRVTSVTVRSVRTGTETRLVAPLVADATELGDLLPLAGVEHVLGAEAAAEFGELHAPDAADPLDQQAISWCCALEWAPGADHTIPRPERYHHFATQVAPFWPGPQLSFDDVEPISLERRTRPVFAGHPDEAAESTAKDLWHYRRILARKNLREGFPGGEVTLVNWPQIDYWDAPLLGVSEQEAAAALEDARQLTLSFVHWLQTEAPRSEGGHGYPELRLRGDVLGTADGLALEPYIRESRRIKALFTVHEGHIGKEMRGEDVGSELFEDSVGTGYYRIDLHPSTSGRSYVDIDCFPFQIPLGALIPADTVNLLAANKNIGTTHITNGAYRLHPVEWSIGEAVGALVALCQDRGATPAEVHADPALRAELQRLLAEDLGVQLRWEESIRRNLPELDAPIAAVGAHSG
ncbi:FAD-dependent oxidoreductase [Auraticoccus monumenti]|uniref:FAD dependent oxidoreductase n=1 Tax=Auraticoccus monumenti TaxID=675864 RepID=A0A1G7D330_9ACTN|nr:FAD-dependent oxidoreductase [Auraticoccus monumenti]SDE45376.1 FAD dependent oxidoreductase [Auraticoccus monumenti]